MEWPPGGSRDSLARPSGDELDLGIRGIYYRGGLVPKIRPERNASSFFTSYLKFKFKFFGLEFLIYAKFVEFLLNLANLLRIHFTIDHHLFCTVVNIRLCLIIGCETFPERIENIGRSNHRCGLHENSP
jgi:hypothetical protein